MNHGMTRDEIVNNKATDPGHSNRLRIVMVGAGGIGCYYGARLLQNGHQVKLVARGDHLQALKETGLTLKHPEFSFHQFVDACALSELTERYSSGDFDLIILCVKATATQEVAYELKRWFQACHKKIPVLSLQNGIDNEFLLAESLGEENIIGGLAVRIGGHILSPGIVEATGIAEVIMGAWPNQQSPAFSLYREQLHHFAQAFNAAGIPTRLVDDIQRELWRKLVINNGVNPLSALTRLDTQTMSHHPQFGKIVAGLMIEAAQVAQADGVMLTEQDAEEMYQLIKDFDPIKTSMLVDMEKGRTLELDEISGAVLQRAEKLGVNLPYTQTVYALLKHKITPPSSVDLV